MLIGVISDTHFLLRPEAGQRLAGVDHIIHAGDIGSPEIIPRLRSIAPDDGGPRQRRRPALGNGLSGAR